MRSGACSVQQALTTEAASVLKLSLTLARRRGHAQVTPLHVAATLLTSSSSSSNLLRRACLKSHPHHLASHPLQCRALELCFNVALNRLPTTPPPSSSSSSSSSLIQSQPCLSNALIAALKRAQAHQRRGCIEQQQHFQLHNQQQQQQQQPLLAVKVELDQLIISILDDPSVSRVMREAGFSSTSVKTNLEEDGTSSLVISSSSSPSLSPSSFFFDSTNRGEIITQSSLLHSHFLKPSFEQIPLARFAVKEDIKVVLEVMSRKQGRRNNTVIVGDSVSIAEGVVSELMGRLERGEVPDELKSSNLIKLQLPYAHLKIMSKTEVELKVTDLKSKVTSVSSSSNGGVIVYVGDLKWALEGETGGGGAVDYLIEEVGMLISELKKKSNKVWLMATSSYQTYMRCQVRHPSLETQWALQAVVVPTGGLKLTLQAPSGLDSRMLKNTQYPFQMLEPKGFNLKEEDDKFHCCDECTSNFDKEASLIKSESSIGATHLPYWLRPHKAENHQKETLLELKRKWNRLCRNLHHSRHSSSVHVLPSYPSSYPWWSSILNDNKKNKTFNEPKPISSPPLPWLCDVKTTLALGNPMFSDTATSTDQRRGNRVNEKELSQQLEDNIPWQSKIIPSILEALSDCPSRNGIWLLVSGSDHTGKKRLARVLAESFFGSTDRFIYFSARSGVEILTKEMRKESKCVVFIEDIDEANGETVETLSKCIKTGLLKDPFGGGDEVGLCDAIFVLAASTATTSRRYVADEYHDKVLQMRLWVEEEQSDSEHKRKSPELEFESGLNDDEEMKKKKKKIKASDQTTELFDLDLNLNICAEDSDLTQEMDGNDQVELPKWLLECTGGVHILTMDDNSPSGSRTDVVEEEEEKMLAKMSSAVADGGLIVDRTAVEGLMGAMGGFLESEFERWVREVFEWSVVTVKKGGKVMVRLGILEGNKEGNVAECGFLGSALPKRIHLG